MGVIICPIAISGTGKSALARKWVQSRRIPPDAVVSADDLRWLLTGNVADQSANNQVFQICRTIIGSRLNRDLTVYSDQTHLTGGARDDAISIAERHRAEIVWVRFTTTWQTIVYRNSHRKHPVPDSVLDRQFIQYDGIDFDALPGSVLVVDDVGNVVP